MGNNFTFYLLSLALPSIFTTNCCSSGQSLILDTCKTSSQDDPNVNFEFCTTSLQAAPSSQFATLYGLGQISIQLVQLNVTDTRSQARELMNKELDQNVKKRLADCYELYNSAIPSIKQAMEFYKSKQFDEANFKVTSVMDAATTCEEGFKEKNIASKLTKRNHDAFELSAIVLSIMHMLQTGSK